MNPSNDNYNSLDEFLLYKANLVLEKLCSRTQEDYQIVNVAALMTQLNIKTPA